MICPSLCRLTKMSGYKPLFCNFQGGFKGVNGHALCFQHNNIVGLLLRLAMDFLRELVGGPKNRYKQNGFNLDLTYISPRIVAMAFPASGIQKLYRNSIDTIAELMETQHHNKYITINISGRSIDQTVLQNVISYQWEDHKAPPFDTLFIICDKVSQYLAGDPERIAVFHCNHGKGRTGTIICCFFLFMKAFKDSNEVMKFYGKRRFQKQGYGVTQPCQIQYIHYFHQFLINPNYYPQVLRIKKLTFRGGFAFSGPYVKLIHMGSGKIIYNTKDFQTALIVQKYKEYSIVFTKKHSFIGDMTLQLKESRVMGKNLVISYVFNTAFVSCQKQETEVYRPTVVKLEEMSPLGKQKQRNFQEDFTIQIEFRKVCHCGELKRIEGCERCKGIVKWQFQRWQRIKAAFQNRESLLSRSHEICGVGQQQSA